MRTPSPELQIPPGLQRGNTFRAVSRVRRSAHGGIGRAPGRTPGRAVYKADARREAAAEVRETAA